MRVIDLLNKIANREINDGDKFKFEGIIYTYDTEYNGTLNLINIKDGYCKYIEQDPKLLEKLNDEIEIIEEPKEELEEIELIDIHYVNDKCIFKVHGQSIEETIAIKVNELIDEVNKLKKERIRNNE
jgi:hypothetical protein